MVGRQLFILMRNTKVKQNVASVPSG